MSEREKIVEVIAKGFNPMATAIPMQHANASVATERIEATVRAEAALAALSAAGYVVVPNAHNMPEQMEEAFFKAQDEYEQLKADKVFPRPSLPAYIYRAMLAAAAQEGT